MAQRGIWTVLQHRSRHSGRQRDVAEAEEAEQDRRHFALCSTDPSRPAGAGSHDVPALRVPLGDLGKQIFWKIQCQAAVF